MKVIETMIELYKNSGEKIVIADTKLTTLWKSHDFLPDIIPQILIKDAQLPTAQSPNKNIIFKFANEFTVKMFPIVEDDQTVGYVLNFMDNEDVEMLYCNSINGQYRKKLFADERVALMPIINEAASFYYDDKDIPKAYYLSTRKNVAKLLSHNVNSNQLSRYYSKEISPKLTSISQVLENISDRFKQKFTDNNLIFESSISPALFAEIDPSCLETAVLNLLINSYMYNHNKEKKIKLKAYKRNHKIVISVWDNGNDFDIKRLQRASKPFSGLDLSSTGECLGLAVVKKFAEYFEGDFSILKENNGLAIKISLPDKNIEPTDFKSRQKAIPSGIYFDSIECIFAKSNEA